MTMVSYKLGNYLGANIKNLDSKELSKKILESKALVKSDLSFLPSFYILMKKQAVTKANLTHIARGSLWYPLIFRSFNF